MRDRRLPDQRLRDQRSQPALQLHLLFGALVLREFLGRILSHHLLRRYAPSCVLDLLRAAIADVAVVDDVAGLRIIQSSVRTTAYTSRAPAMTCAYPPRACLRAKARNSFRLSDTGTHLKTCIELPIVIPAPLRASIRRTATLVRGFFLQNRLHPTRRRSAVEVYDDDSPDAPMFSAGGNEREPMEANLRSSLATPTPPRTRATRTRRTIWP